MVCAANNDDSEELPPDPHPDRLTSYELGMLEAFIRNNDPTGFYEPLREKICRLIADEPEPPKLD